jgi:hypothetical protein
MTVTLVLARLVQMLQLLQAAVHDLPSAWGACTIAKGAHSFRQEDAGNKKLDIVSVITRMRRRTVDDWLLVSRPLPVYWLTISCTEYVPSSSRLHHRYIFLVVCRVHTL